MKEWFSPAELADAKLPDLPNTHTAVADRARRENWKERARDGRPLARKRKGRGGGWEYHYSILPATAQVALAARGLIRPETIANILASCASPRVMLLTSAQNLSHADQRWLVEEILNGLIA